MTNSHDPASFLRASLRANAGFSALSGAIFSLGGGPVAHFLGIEPATLVHAVGVNLLGFAAVLLYIAARRQISATIAIGIIAADVVWVLGTGVLVYGEVFSREGAIAALTVANIVLGFAVLQSIGVRRLNRGPVAA